MEIYRLENIYHLGPYIGSHICNSYFNTEYHLNNDLIQAHKDTRMAISIINYPNLGAYDICGLATQKEVEDWFNDGWLKILNNRGFFIVKYEVSDCFVTKYYDGQLTFDITKSQPISMVEKDGSILLLSTNNIDKFVTLADNFSADLKCYVKTDKGLVTPEPTMNLIPVKKIISQ